MENTDRSDESRWLDKDMCARVVLDQLPLPIYTVDLRGRLTYFNAAAIRLWGRMPGVGRGGGWLTGRKGPSQRCSTPGKLACSTGQPPPHHAAMPTPALPARQVLVPHATPLIDSDGTVMGRVNVLVDDPADESAEAPVRSIIEQCSDDDGDYVDFFENAAVGLQWCGSDGVIMRVNRTQLRMLGYDESEYVGRNFSDFIVDQGAAQDVFAKLSQGGTIRDLELLVRCSDGSLRDILLSSNVFWRGCEFAHTRCTLVDITQRKQAERRAQMLALEVNHRAKNLLAVVLALVRHTADHAPPDVYAECLEKRIAGLAASHDLVSRGNWCGVKLDTLIESQLHHLLHLVGVRIRLSGPAIVLNSAAAQAIGMALHELQTNACKYGSLVGEVGCVDVEWQFVDRHGACDFRLSWCESGGPPATPPSHRGFGHIVTVDLIEHELQAVVDARFEEAGFRWSLACDALNVIEDNRTNKFFHDGEVINGDSDR